MFESILRKSGENYGKKLFFIYVRLFIPLSFGDWNCMDKNKIRNSVTYSDGIQI